MTDIDQSKSMSLHVVSDGTPEGTIIRNAETGERLTNISEIRFAIMKPNCTTYAEVVLWVPVSKAELTTRFQEIEPGKHSINTPADDLAAHRCTVSHNQ